MTKLLSTEVEGRDSKDGMSKTFRCWDVDQIWLLLPSVQDLVPARTRRRTLPTTSPLCATSRSRRMLPRTTARPRPARADAAPSTVAPPGTWATGYRNPAAA